jgi:hypothetical protein
MSTQREYLDALEVACAAIKVAPWGSCAAMAHAVRACAAELEVPNETLVLLESILDDVCLTEEPPARSPCRCLFPGRDSARRCAGDLSDGPGIAFVCGCPCHLPR